MYSLKSWAGQLENSSWSWEGFSHTPIHREGQVICGKSEKIKEVYELSKVTGAPFQVRIPHWREITKSIIQTKRIKVIGVKENKNIEKIRGKQRSKGGIFQKVWHIFLSLCDGQQKRELQTLENPLFLPESSGMLILY